MIIRSILDQDNYKFSMATAIAHHYPHVEAEYEFFNRGKTQFPVGFANELIREIEEMQELYLSDDEEAFLREKCSYLKPTYIDMFRGHRFDPTKVHINQEGGNLSIFVKDLMYKATLWEVPLLAIVSELYYKMTQQPPNVIDWKKEAANKFRRMSEAGCLVSDFGTRRRHSFKIQDGVVRELKRFSCCVGTSNVHIAHRHGLTPIGTMAHEWVMAHACMFGYRQANKKMMEAWVDVYEGNLGIALPDTFTTDVFLRDFNSLNARIFDGVRHDSGDWKEFTNTMVNHWEGLGIDPSTKAIVYSDGLTDKKAIEIQKYAEGKVLPRFGIGTFLSNNVGRTPLNIVIKLTKCDGHHAIKLSDSPGKVTMSPSCTAPILEECKAALEID